jgi:RimJ/RimL family protein N-acetyltransferase
MKLLPLDRPEPIERAARWLARKENYQWLGFGDAGHVITPALLKVMAEQDTHFLRLYALDEDDIPIGIVGLNNVSRNFRTGTLWGANGEKSFRSRGYATFAASMFLSLVFRELGLHSVNTWVVEHNTSVRLLERLNFRYVGRQRQCHYIDGRPFDRLLFDLLASEHRDLGDTHWRERQ